MEQVPLNPPQNIPPSGVRQFVGREDVLKTLDQQLQETKTVAISAIAGMGGVGKTELVLQYALATLTAKQYTGGICWLDARSLDVGIQIVNFARTYLKLQLPDGLELPNQVAYCWRNWLAGDVLVVIDDVTKYEDVKPYLPPTDPRFKVLMTTRLQLGKPIKRLDLDVLTPEAALAMLRSYIEDERVDNELQVAEKLCEWLGIFAFGVGVGGALCCTETRFKLRGNAFSVGEETLRTASSEKAKNRR